MARLASLKGAGAKAGSSIPGNFAAGSPCRTSMRYPHFIGGPTLTVARKSRTARHESRRGARREEEAAAAMEAEMTDIADSPADRLFFSHLSRTLSLSHFSPHMTTESGGEASAASEEERPRLRRLLDIAWKGAC